MDVPAIEKLLRTIISDYNDEVARFNSALKAANTAILAEFGDGIIGYIVLFS